MKKQREKSVCMLERLSGFLTKLSNISMGYKQISKSLVIPLYICEILKISQGKWAFIQGKLWSLNTKADEM